MYNKLLFPIDCANMLFLGTEPSKDNSFAYIVSNIITITISHIKGNLKWANFLTYLTTSSIIAIVVMITSYYGAVEVS